MKALDLLSNSYARTLKFIKKLTLRDWVILGVLNLFSGGSGTGLGQGLPSGGNGVDKTNLWDILLIVGVILAFGLGVGVIVLIFTWFFRFNIYDVVATRKVRFDLLKKKGPAVQMIIFSIIMGIFVIGTLGAFGVSMYSAVEGGNTSIAVIVLALLFALVTILISVLIGILTNNFVTPDLYFREVSILSSIPSVFSAVRKNFWESVAFILIKLGLGMILGIASFIVAVITSIIFVIAGVILAIPGVILGMIVPVIITPVVAGGILAVVAGIILLMLIVSTLTAPLTLFVTDYTLEFYKKVLKKSIN